MIKKEKEKGTYGKEKKIRRFGYEYTLVECTRDYYTPTNALGVPGYILKSFKKLDGSK